MPKSEACAGVSASGDAPPQPGDLDWCIFALFALFVQPYCICINTANQRGSLISSKTWPVWNACCKCRMTADKRPKRLERLSGPEKLEHLDDHGKMVVRARRR